MAGFTTERHDPDLVRVSAALLHAGQRAWEQERPADMHDGG